MKLMPVLLLAASFAAHGAFAQEAEDPFEETLEARKGLMLLMATDVGKLGAMAKGESDFDAAAATKSATNVAALATILSPDLFPAGSDSDAVEDSDALPAIWTDEADFTAKITGLQDASAKLQTAAGTDLAGLQAGMKDLGAACSACHKAYRKPDE